MSEDALDDVNAMSPQIAKMLAETVQEHLFMNIQPNRYYTITEMAKLVGVHRGTLYARNSRGLPMPPTHDIFGGLRYKGADIVAWMDAQPEFREVA